MRRRGITLLELAFAGTIIFALLWVALPRLREGIQRQRSLRFQVSTDYVYAGKIDALKAHVKKHGKQALYHRPSENLSLLHVAAVSGDAKMTRTVLEIGIPVDTKTDAGFTPLIFAICFWPSQQPVQQLEAVIQVLELEGAEIDAGDGFGMSALIYTSMQGHVSVVDYLVAHGADVNAYTSFVTPSTPLFAAVSKNRQDVVSYLLDHGADVSVLDIHGEHVLHAAARAGNEIVLDWILDRVDDVDMRAEGTGHTPIYFAAREGHVACVRILLAHGADPAPAIDIATRKDNETMLSALLSGNGADPAVVAVDRH